MIKDYKEIVLAEQKVKRCKNKLAIGIENTLDSLGLMESVSVQFSGGMLVVNYELNGINKAYYDIMIGFSNNGNIYSYSNGTCLNSKGGNGGNSKSRRIIRDYIDAFIKCNAVRIDETEFLKCHGL